MYFAAFLFLSTAAGRFINNSGINVKITIVLSDTKQSEFLVATQIIVWKYFLYYYLFYIISFFSNNNYKSDDTGPASLQGTQCRFVSYQA